MTSEELSTNDWEAERDRFRNKSEATPTEKERANTELAFSNFISAQVFSLKVSHQIFRLQSLFSSLFF